MGKRITVYAGLAGVLLGLLVLLSGCTSAGDETAAPATSPPDEAAAVETESSAEPNVPDPPADNAVDGQADEKDAPPAVAEKLGPAVELALKYVPGQTTTYKVTTETEKSIKWEGNTAKKPAMFRGGRTGYRVEMTFDQQIERVTDEGNGIVVVTIKALRYRGQAHQKTVVDFDSARAGDPERPLAKLIGQSYTVEMTPKGMVASVSDVEPARAAVGGQLPEHNTALKLISDKTIRQRHEIPALIALEAAEVQPQEHWSSVRTFSFGMMGTKAYERVYTFEGVEQGDDRRSARVAMEAIPSAVASGQSQAANPLGMMFDNTDSYTGQLRVDLNSGQIEQYIERFSMQWVTADPASVESGDTNPAVLKMGAAELHQLERIE